MKKSFSSIVNDTPAIKDDISIFSSHSVAKTQSSRVKTLQQSIQSPGQLNCLRQNLQVCRKCFLTTENGAKLIRPCMCVVPIHLECLQQVINEKSEDFSNTLGKLKCKKCRILYSIEVQKICSFKYDELCHFSGFILVNYLIFIVILAGIIGLSFFYKQICGQIIEEKQSYGSIAKKDSSQSNKTDMLMSKDEAKVITIIGILLLLISLIILLINCFKKHVIMNKLKVIHVIQNQAFNFRNHIHTNISNSYHLSTILKLPSQILDKK